MPPSMFSTSSGRLSTIICTSCAEKPAANRCLVSAARAGLRRWRSPHSRPAKCSSIIPRIDDSSLITVSLTTCSMRALIASATEAGVRASSLEDGAGAFFCAARRAAACAPSRAQSGVSTACGAGVLPGSTAAPRPLAIAAAGVIAAGRALYAPCGCCSAAMRRAWSISHGFDSAMVRGVCASGARRARRSRYAGRFEQIGADVFGETRRRGAGARLFEGDRLRRRRRCWLDRCRCLHRRGRQRFRRARQCGLRRVRGRLHDGGRCVARVFIGVAGIGVDRAVARILRARFRACAEHRREHIGHAARVRIRLHRRCCRHGARCGERRLSSHDIHRSSLRCAGACARNLRRDGGEVAVGQCDDLDAAVVHRAIGQYDGIRAQRFAHETQRITTGSTDKFTNVQAGPPMR